MAFILGRLRTTAHWLAGESAQKVTAIIDDSQSIMPSRRLLRKLPSSKSVETVLHENRRVILLVIGHIYAIFKVPSRSFARARYLSVLLVRDRQSIDTTWNYNHE